MVNVGDVIVGIQAEDMTKAGVDSARRNLSGLAGVGARAFNVVRTGALAAGAATAGLAAGTVLLTKNYAAYVKEMKLVADTTGASVKQVSALTEEFKRVGLEGEDVRDVLNELNIKQGDALDGTQSIIDAYAVFGLSLQDIADMNAHEQLLAIADGFSQVESHAQAAWAADAIFGGDMAQRTIPILQQGRDALLENAEAYAAMGLVIDEGAVAAAERYDAAQIKLNQTLAGFGNTIGAAVLPHLTNVVTAINAILRVGQGFLRLLPNMQRGTVSFAQAFSAVWAGLPPEIQQTLTVLGLNFAAALNNMLKSIWSFGFKVEQGFADVVNSMLEQVDPGGVLGRATPGNRFSGAAPSIELPREIVAAGRRERLRSQITSTTYIPGADASPAYTVEAGDTLWDLRRQGVDTSAYTGDPRELPIGFQFPGSPGTEGRFVTQPLDANQGIIDAYAAYQQSLIQPDRSTPEAAAAAAADFRSSVDWHLQDAAQNPLKYAAGTAGGLILADILDRSMFRIPSRVARGAARATRLGVRLGGNLTSLYNNRLTQGLTARLATRLTGGFARRPVTAATQAAARSSWLSRLPRLLGSTSTSGVLRAGTGTLSEAAAARLARLNAAMANNTAASRAGSESAQRAAAEVAAEGTQDWLSRAIRFAGGDELVGGLPRVLRPGARLIGRAIPLIDVLEYVAASQPTEGRGDVSFARTSGPRSNLPYFDLRRYLAERAQLLPPGAAGSAIRPLTAFAGPGAGFNPAVNQLGDSFGLFGGPVNPAWQFTGDPYEFRNRYQNPFTVWDPAYNARGDFPSININIQVDDTEDFITRLNDVIETGAVTTLTEAYESERRGGE